MKTQSSNEEKGKEKVFPATKEKKEKKEECVFYRIDFLFQLSPFSVQIELKEKSNKTYDHCRNHGRMQSRVLVNMREKRKCATVETRLQFSSIRPTYTEFGGRTMKNYETEAVKKIVWAEQGRGGGVDPL